MSNFKMVYDDTVGYICQTTIHPKELEKDPRLFDEMVRTMDHRKFFDDDPLVSGVMTKFTVVSGDLSGKYHWGEYRIEGLARKFRKGKEPQYFLRCRLTDGWYEVDNSLPVKVPPQKAKEEEKEAD